MKTYIFVNPLGDHKVVADLTALFASPERDRGTEAKDHALYKGTVWLDTLEGYSAPFDHVLTHLPLLLADAPIIKAVLAGQLTDIVGLTEGLYEDIEGVVCQIASYGAEPKKFTIRIESVGFTGWDAIQVVNDYYAALVENPAAFTPSTPWVPVVPLA